jgi:hypothetical protein
VESDLQDYLQRYPVGCKPPFPQTNVEAAEAATAA